MKFSRSAYLKAAGAALAVAALGTASVAQARSDVYFSVGANVAPGVAIGVSNAPPVYYPQPVYVQPAPVYYPQAVYAPAPVYVRPAPVYYAPTYGVTYVRPGWNNGRHHGRGHGHHR